MYMELFSEFMDAAFPWIVMALLLAIFFAFYANRKKE